MDVKLLAKTLQVTVVLKGSVDIVSNGAYGKTMLLNVLHCVQICRVYTINIRIVMFSGLQWSKGHFQQAIHVLPMCSTCAIYSLFLYYPFAILMLTIQYH